MHSRAIPTTRRREEHSSSLIKKAVRAALGILSSPLLLVASLAALIFFTRLTPPVELNLAPKEIAHVDGHAYSARIPKAATDSLLFSAISDAEGRSNLLLLEDGRPFGEAHVIHAEIAASGGGRYSHWMDSVRFSTADGTSPAGNGRRYSVRFTPTAKPGILTALAVIAALPFAAMCFNAARSVARAGFTGSVGIVAMGCAAVVLAAAIHPIELRTPIVPSEIYAVDGAGFGYDLTSLPFTLTLVPGSAYIEVDGARLKLAASPLEVVSAGTGKFFEREGAVLFSTFDGSDPRNPESEFFAGRSVRPALPTVFLSLAALILVLVGRRRVFESSK